MGKLSPRKFNSLPPPLKSYLGPKKDRKSLPSIIFRGREGVKLLNFKGCKTVYTLFFEGNRNQHKIESLSCKCCNTLARKRSTLVKTNISRLKCTLESMIFIFQWWDRLVSWSVILHPTMEVQKIIFPITLGGSHGHIGIAFFCYPLYPIAIGCCLQRYNFSEFHAIGYWKKPANFNLSLHGAPQN